MRKSVYTHEYRALCTAMKSARSTAGLTQRDLAAQLNVPHSWVAKVESGERRIDLIEFCWLMAACNGDASDLVRGIINRARMTKTRTRTAVRR